MRPGALHLLWDRLASQIDATAHVDRRGPPTLLPSTPIGLDRLSDYQGAVDVLVELHESFCQGCGQHIIACSGCGTPGSPGTFCHLSDLPLVGLVAVLEARTKDFDLQKPAVQSTLQNLESLRRWICLRNDRFRPPVSSRSSNYSAD